MEHGNPKSLVPATDALVWGSEYDRATTARRLVLAQHGERANRRTYPAPVRDRLDALDATQRGLRLDAMRRYGRAVLPLGGNTWRCLACDGVLSAGCACCEPPRCACEAFVMPRGGFACPDCGEVDRERGPQLCHVCDGIGRTDCAGASLAGRGSELRRCTHAMEPGDEPHRCGTCTGRGWTRWCGECGSILRDERAEPLPPPMGLDD